MKRIATLFILLLFLLTGLAEGRGRSRSSSPRYGGSRHTQSHGGRYAGGRGSSHKGGQYRNPRTNNHYGHHKR